MRKAATLLLLAACGSTQAAGGPAGQDGPAPDGASFDGAAFDGASAHDASLGPSPFDASTSGCNGSLCGYCPAATPMTGDTCAVPQGQSQWYCTWGDHPNRRCRTSATCGVSGHFMVTAPEPVCAQPANGCPSTKTDNCSASSGECIYPDGSDCVCVATGKPPACSSPPPIPSPCPAIAPNAGAPCTLASGTKCVAQVCMNSTEGFAVLCQDGVWQWEFDSTCLPRVCASPDTPVATPFGERPIADFRVGDLVYSVDHGAIVAVPIVRVRRQEARHHHVIRVTTADGRRLEISSPHPTADGRTFGALRPGERLDGHLIEAVEVIAFEWDSTYDILPGSETGSYFAAGMQIGSTLR